MAPIRTQGSFKSLCVEYPINLATQNPCRIQSRKYAPSPSRRLSLAPLTSSRQSFSVLWAPTLKFCPHGPFESIFAAEIRCNSKNLRTSQTENLYRPVREGGLGYQRFSSMVQQCKRNCVTRLLAHGDEWTRFASVQGLCSRGHRSPSQSPLHAITPHGVRPGFWVSSLLSYGFQGNACRTKALRSEAARRHHSYLTPL